MLGGNIYHISHSHRHIRLKRGDCVRCRRRTRDHCGGFSGDHDSLGTASCSVAKPVYPLYFFTSFFFLKMRPHLFGNTRLLGRTCPKRFAQSSLAMPDGATSARDHCCVDGIRFVQLYLVHRHHNRVISVRFTLNRSHPHSFFVFFCSRFLPLRTQVAAALA